MEPSKDKVALSDVAQSRGEEVEGPLGNSAGLGCSSAVGVSQK